MFLNAQQQSANIQLGGATGVQNSKETSIQNPSAKRLGKRKMQFTTSSTFILKDRTRMTKPKGSCNYFHNILIYRVTGE